jgi:predicted choloylglycine hydrolase
MSFISFAQIAIISGIAISVVTTVPAEIDSAKSLRFQERQVAGTADDLMIVRYLRLEGTNEQIGAKLAEIARDRHGSKGDRAQGDYAVDQLTWLKQNWPEMAERSAGVAKVFGSSSRHKDFDPSSLSYNLTVRPGCSVVYYPPRFVGSGHAMLSRNYDFPTGTYAEITGRAPTPGARSMTGDPYVIECRPDRGFASLYTCSYDLLGCIDGINEKGLAVALLADDASPDRKPSVGAGLNELTLTRFVLDRCATAKQARALLSSAPYHYSFTPCHYMICDASGDSFVWEITPDLKKRFVIDGAGKPQIVTNHLLGVYGEQNLPEGNSFDRYRRLKHEIMNRHESVSEAEALSINQCVAVPKEAKGAATLWHAVYDLSARKVKISFFLGRNAQGADRRTPYLDFAFNR